jgi:hypothetical protein
MYDTSFTSSSQNNRRSSIPFGPAVDATPGTESESFQSLQVVARTSNTPTATPQWPTGPDRASHFTQPEIRTTLLFLNTSRVPSTDNLVALKKVARDYLTKPRKFLLNSDSPRGSNNYNPSFPAESASIFQPFPSLWHKIPRGPNVMLGYNLCQCEHVFSVKIS